MFVVHQMLTIMKNLKFVILSLTLVFMGFSASSENLNNSDDSLKEEIKEASDSLNAALQEKNYKVAKQALDLLFPLMKKDIKLSKKEVADLKKSGEKQASKQLAGDLKRKEDIHDLLHAMVDSSSAGLRVKSNTVKLLVEEYLELLDEQEQLLSANN